MAQSLKSYRSLVAAGALAVGIVGGISSANATIVLQTNFNSDPIGGNATLTDGVFTGSTVDVVGGTFYGSLAFQGNSIDLNGSPGVGAITSLGTIGPGSYTLSFELSGSQRGSLDSTSKTTTITLGSFSTSYTLPPGSGTPVGASGYTLYSIPVTTTIAGKLIFADLAGGNDSIGNLLDDVTLTTVSPGIPEPSTWAMMLLGFFGLGFAGYRKSKTRLSLRD